MKVKFLLFGFILSLFLVPSTFANADDNGVKLLLPNDLNWHLYMDLPDFGNPELSISKEGDEVYFFAQNKKTQMAVSVFMQSKQLGDGIIACRNYYKRERAKNRTIQKSNMRDWIYKGNIAINEYEIRNIGGEPIMMKNYFGCMVKDDKWIEIHISKMDYKMGDRTMFIDILRTVKILDGAPKEYESAMVEEIESVSDKNANDYFLLGNNFFNKKDYVNAIKNYRQAFNLNKETWEMGAIEWHIMIDNFGMAYGITGDYKRALDILNFGIENSPEYPMFYYNSACTYAEMGNIIKANQNLSKAYLYRENMLPGEKIPNPLEDSSFVSLLGDSDFIKIANRINNAR